MTANHVILASPSLEASPILDKFLGCLLALCLISGPLSNLLALRYFMVGWRKGSIAKRLYTVICAADTCTCVLHLPVMLVLLVGREPVLFANHTFCAIWSIVFEFQQRFTIFLSMLLSVTRAVAITFPYFNMKERAVFGAIGLFVISTAIQVIVGFALNLSFVYIKDFGYALKTIRDNPKSQGQLDYLLWIDVIYNIEIIGPLLITFFSFLVSVFQLHKNKALTRGNASSKHRASTTIALFTALSLILNLPCFVTLACYIVDKRILNQFPGPAFSLWFIYWYMFPLSKIVLVTLNAALNPLLYYLRMPGFKSWIHRTHSSTTRLYSRSTTGYNETVRQGGSGRSRKSDVIGNGCETLTEASLEGATLETTPC